MAYVLNTPDDQRAMLQRIGVPSVQDLFQSIPPGLRLKRPLKVPPALTEMELGQHLQELEEAWLVQALVREDGMTQLEAAELLDRHKSWVCRRLALLERLCEKARGELRLGLLAPRLAQQLA